MSSLEQLIDVLNTLRMMKVISDHIPNTCQEACFCHRGDGPAAFILASSDQNYYCIGPSISVIEVLDLSEEQPSLFLVVRGNNNSLWVINGLSVPLNAKTN